MSGARTPGDPPPDAPPPDAPPPGGPPSEQPSAVRLAGTALLTLTATLVAYYALPIYGDAAGRRLPLRVVLFTVGLVGTAALLSWQAVGTRHAAPHRATVQWLFAGICLTVVLFSTTYYSLALGVPGQLVGIRTKTDALYFAVTVLTTVGFGDVHAAGQVARVVVTIQMGFDVVFVATAGAALRASGAARRARHGS